MAVVVLMMASSLPCSPTVRRTRSTTSDWWPVKLPKACEGRRFISSNPACELNRSNVNMAKTSVQTLKSAVDKMDVSCNGELQNLTDVTVPSITGIADMTEKMAKWYPYLVHLTAYLFEIKTNAVRLDDKIKAENNKLESAYNNLNHVICDMNCITNMPNFVHPSNTLHVPEIVDTSQAKIITCIVMKNLTRLMTSIQASQ